MTFSEQRSTSGWRALMFWGGLFLLILQAERFFLLREAIAADPPATSLLAKTILIGFGNDLFVALGGLGIAAGLAGLLASLRWLFRLGTATQSRFGIYRSSLTLMLAVVAVVLAMFSTADICYYAYNRQHLDFVFFEFVDELFHGVSQGTSSQAAEQTGAELEDASKWIRRIGEYWGLGALLIVAWSVFLKRVEHPGVGRWKQAHLALGMALMFASACGAAAGLGRVTWPFTETLHIENEAYYSLSQNPILFVPNPLRDAFLSQWTWSASRLPQPLQVGEAIQEARVALGDGELFSFSDYPLVRVHRESEAPYFNHQVNVLLVFVEGLDRRFLDHLHPVGEPLSAGGQSPESASLIRITPFLDRLKEDSLYFSHFFSNGVQTTRGLFSTLCSAFPRQGTAVIKTRYTHDYLCLPSLLRKAGYRTEMVVSLDNDLPGLEQFLERNGIDRYYGEHDFPSNAERLGVGLTDGALLDFVEARLDALQASAAPFFLTTLTAGTHHPFSVPADHPDVKVLQRESDQYMAALRYFDLTFERFFSRLQAKGLLRNTMVIILGDHGRHEPIGKSDIERQAGHFLAPLYVWLDDSLRKEGNYRPRVVTQVASQVDIAPTILSINGLFPRVAPFVGRNFTCLLKNDCVNDNRAYLSSVYDDLIGLADQSGLWLYSFRRNSLTAVDLDLRNQASYLAGDEPSAAKHVRTMTAWYLAFNTLLEENKVWSWSDLGEKL